jgi:hypothetical protein
LSGFFLDFFELGSCFQIKEAVGEVSSRAKTDFTANWAVTETDPAFVGDEPSDSVENAPYLSRLRPAARGQPS